MTSTHKEKATLAGAAFKSNFQVEFYQNQTLKQEETVGAAYTIGHLCCDIFAAKKEGGVL